MRKIQQKINYLLQNQSIVLIEGGIETGKTSFIKDQYPDYEYVTLKNKNHKNLIEKDPYRFFTLYINKTVFDDIEEIPNFIELIITYSLSIYQLGNYILISNIKQSINTALVQKCSFSPLDLSELKSLKRFKLNLESTCIQSSFPALKNYNSYLTKIFSEQFSKLVRIQKEAVLFALIQECVFYVDKPLNINAIAKKLKHSQPTIQIWLEAFEKIGLIHFLNPLDVSFNKRIIKSPKIYFADCGLLAHLLKIKTSENLLKGDYFYSIYSNLVFLEFYKKNELEITPKQIHYWKESNGHEIKFLIKNPTSYDIYSLISSHEVSKKDYKELDFFDEISEGKVLSRNIIYGAFKNFIKNETSIISWQLI